MLESFFFFSVFFSSFFSLIALFASGIVECFFELEWREVAEGRDCGSHCQALDTRGVVRWEAPAGVLAHVQLLHDGSGGLGDIV